MSDPLNTMILLFQILIPLIMGTILFSSTLLSTRRRLVAIFLILGLNGPFIYSLFNKQAEPAKIGDRGLELSMLFVWTFSIVLIILAFIRIFLKIIGHNRKNSLHKQK